jgi:DNA-binding winged helix-turn-helix (wHTH) protein
MFELDTARNILLRNGNEIRLQPQPLTILVALVERAPDEITREELCARLWPDGTFVEFETAIATAIRKVRQALGDSADNPIYVKTMHRRGYRFIAPVQAMGPPAAPEALPEPAGPQVEPESAPAVSATNRPYWNNRRNLIPVLAAAGVISVLAFAAVKGPALLSRKSPPSTVNQLTTFLGDEYQPSFSPDGNQVAFVWNGEDDANVDIYVMETDGGRGIRRLTTSPAREDRPAWSPDGRWIAFMRDGHAILIS